MDLSAEDQRFLEELQALEADGYLICDDVPEMTEEEYRRMIQDDGWDWYDPDQCDIHDWLTEGF